MNYILVIDDEVDLREEVMDWLLLEDYEVKGAANGLEGIKLAFEAVPDLVICDITMPQLDGHGVLMELRSNPATAAVPFIFVTARASHEDIRKGVSLGADDYITKPFTRLELLQAVESRLEKKALQDELIHESVQQWQQAFEEEREQRLMKGKLVSMFSHDFRNPLATILFGVSMVRNYYDRMDEERRLKHLDRALSSVRQLSQMLDDMLVTSQMEAGHLVCRPKPLLVTDFLKQIVDDFQVIHHETHTLVLQSTINDEILLDERLLRQIVSNLISNALKYSPKGGQIGVNVGIEKQTFTLTVSDKGIGIPEAEQANLFEAFQRASNVGKIKGTGLGLAIVKEAVELHGGRVTFESQPNVGTIFVVKIPLG